MDGVDTNVLVRFVMGDDIEQHQRAADLISSLRERNALYLSTHVLCEFEWVVRSAYKVPRARRLAWLLGFATADDVEVDQPLVTNALVRFERTKIDFADAVNLELAGSRGCLRFWTFDEAILRDFSRSQPAARKP